MAKSEQWNPDREPDKGIAVAGLVHPL